MRLPWVALLCLAGCTPPSSVARTNGGETIDETSRATSGETSTTSPGEEAEAETGSALRDPPPPASVQTTDASPAQEATENTAVETETAEPAPVRPTTILAPARSGRLRLAAVHEVIRDHRADVTQCYEEGLSRDRSLAGEAKVRFLVGPRGRIEDAEVYESTLNDDVVEQCILTAMREWHFPRPRPRGSSVLLTYPYSLATE